MKEKQRKFNATEYKKATEQIIKELSKINKVNIVDVNFIDEYTVDSKVGENSMVEFHITECPGWKFGLWWKPFRKIDTPFYKPAQYDLFNIKGDFFAQYETSIDKFKPSCSYNKVDVIIDNVNNTNGYLYEAITLIEFIKDYPALAFCRDYKGINYNLHYFPLEKAQIIFDKYIIWYNNKQLKTQEFNHRIMAFIKKKVKPTIKGCKIIDFGENCSPRYELIAPLSKNPDIVKVGCYSCFDDNESGRELKQEYDDIYHACINESDIYEFLWCGCINDAVVFVDDATWESVKKEKEWNG